MERRRLLHTGGKLRSRQRVLAGGSEEVFPFQRCQGQGEERKAVQGRWHLLSVLMDACCQEQESRLLAAPGSAPRAAEAKENISRMPQKAGEAPSSQESQVLIAPTG